MSEEKPQEQVKTPQSNPVQPRGPPKIGEEPSPSESAKGAEDSDVKEVEVQEDADNITAELDVLDKEVEKEAESEIKKKNKRLASKFHSFDEIAKEKEAETEEAKKSLSKEVKEAKEKLVEIRDKLMTMQWDLEHGQINPAKKLKYQQLKEEFDKLQKMLKEA